MRRLLIFLVEKLTKETANSSNQAGSDENDTSLKGKSKQSLKNRIAKKIHTQLNQFWLPPNCKLNGLRVQENDQLEKEARIHRSQVFLRNTKHQIIFFSSTRFKRAVNL